MRAILTFILGILISVPVSIFANMMTPKVQASWSKRNTEARARYLARVDSYQRMTAWFREHPSVLNTCLLRLGLRALIPLTFGMVFTGAALALAATAEDPTDPLAVRAGYRIAIIFWSATGTACLAHAIFGLRRAIRLADDVALWSGWPLDKDDLRPPRSASANVAMRKDWLPNPQRSRPDA